MSRHGIASNIKTRIYLEGRLVENAMTSVIVNGAIGSPSTAQVTLVPTNTIKHIMPGTWVHVFTTDPWNNAAKGDLSDFRLLFEGIVVGRGFTRQDDGRSLVIQCADPSIFWVEARQFWINATSAGGGIVDQMVMQTTGGYGRFTILGSTGTYGFHLSKLSQIVEGEERFMDTMLAVIDDVGNVNPFYTNARNRFRITDRIIRASAGRTEQLFQLNMLGDFLTSLAQQSSSQTNLAEVVNMLLASILHEWVSLPAPPYVKSRIFKRDVFGNLCRNKETVPIKGTTKKADKFTYGMAEDDIVASIIFKPDVYTLSPPTCNVLFPNMYESASFSENFLSQTTRLTMRPNLVMRNLASMNTTGLLLMRPTELEIFTAITRNKKVNQHGKREPDAKYAGGESQAPNYHDYDWTTNEERIRGIVYNNMDLPPAPSWLTMSDPGKKTPDGARVGGVPKYLQNVASYEYYKSKFASRQTSIRGPLNIRPVVGFPMLFLDDSAANLNIICQLKSITHSISADGSAHTEYGLETPRLVDEVDYNQPKFSGGMLDGSRLNLDLLRGEDGQYQFEKLFDALSRPPIPEWFSDDFKTTSRLDITYRKWFGDKCRVLESVLFAESGAVNNDNDLSEQLSAVRLLQDRYRRSRDNGREYEEASIFTERAFTSIGEAFKFVGAAPEEIIDRVAGTIGEGDITGTIDYSRHKLRNFVGTAASGFGYSGAKIGQELKPPTTTTTTTDGTAGTTAAVVPSYENRMSAAFPVFDVTTHTGSAATDSKVRNELLATERKPSDYARYDGRPIMFDFEYRLWQKSLEEAGYTPDSERMAAGAEQSDYVVTDGGGTRRATPEEQASNTKKRLEAEAAQKLKGKGHKSKARRAKTSMSAAAQAPTGTGLETNERQALPQPLSEKQVIDLRRSIIDAYREELEKNRGFSG